MPVRFPAPLIPGDLIAVTAPSAGVPPALHPRLDLALASLRARGYRVREGQCLRACQHHVSAGSAARADELMRFLSDPEVAAIMPPWGGEFAIDLLPLLDFERLARLPPKWFVGFSDLSTLHLPLTTRAGWATLHGPNLMELGSARLDPVTAGLWPMLTATGTAPLTQTAGPLHRAAAWADWVREPAADLTLTEPVRWRRLDGESSPQSLRGRLIGGCLDTIAHLAGTAYGDVPGFVAAQGNDGTLIYLENCELPARALCRTLAGLRLHGWFDGVAGILLGRSTGPDARSTDDYTELHAMRQALDGLSCPVLYDLDIGHVPPQFSLVNGAMAELQFDGERGWLQQWLAR